MCGIVDSQAADKKPNIVMLMTDDTKPMVCNGFDGVGAVPF
jgi:hypothetical protein